MFGISFEHILIVGVIFILVGPRRLPEIGSAMGKAVKNFKDAFSGIQEANFSRIPPAAKPAAETPPVTPTEEKSTKVS
jgi:TatA/E family protein of Tat protein translocase